MSISLNTVTPSSVLHAHLTNCVNRTTVATHEHKRVETRSQYHEQHTASEYFIAEDATSKAADLSVVMFYLVLSILTLFIQ
jgi:hypothetical protein